MNTIESSLFVVNGVDITRFITVPSYKVNEFSVSSEWTDANEVTHRDVIRKRVKGSFSVLFDNEKDYTDFLKLIDENTTPGDYIIATVFVNNKNRTMTKNFFIDMEPQNEIPFMGHRELDGFDVDIEES